MTAIDIIIILIFIAATCLGYRKGIITQLGSFVAIIIAIIACRTFGQQVEDLIMEANHDWQTTAIPRYTVSIAANCAIYLITYYLVVFIARLLRTVTHAVFLGPIDRIAGAAFSLAKYFLVVSLLINVYIAIFPSTTLLSRSRLGSGKIISLVTGFAPWVFGSVAPIEHDTTPQPTPVKITGTATTEYVSPL